MAKKRISLRLEDDEVAVVGPLSRWNHLIWIYETLAEEHPSDTAAWIEAADWVRDWITKARIQDEEMVDDHS